MVQPDLNSYCRLVKIKIKRVVNYRFRFLAQDVIYTSRAYATMSVSVCLSVCPAVCDGSALAHYS